MADPISRGHLIAMPYPGRGHINPMMNLCTLLASKELLVTFVLTEEWLGLIDSGPKAPNIRLLSIPNVVPSETNRAADFGSFIDAVYTNMEAPFRQLLKELDLPPTCIISDFYLPWMASVGNQLNIPVVLLWTMAPSLFSIFFHHDTLVARNHSPVEDRSGRGNEVIDYIPGVAPMRFSDLPSVQIGRNRNMLKHILDAFAAAMRAQAVVFTSFHDLQPQVIKVMESKLLPMSIYTVGPSIPYTDNRVSERQIAYINWLDSQPEKSVLFVSLGSFLLGSKEQMHELYLGLVSSGVQFLWVARGMEALCLQEGCSEKGLMVPWCDQLKVLCHSSVGGFLTHCGWNSTLESIYAGVPMLTFPLFGDQDHNSKLIVEDWGIGLRLKERLGNKNTVGREEITRGVKRVMDLNDSQGKEIRRRALELQESSHRAVQAGGSTPNNIAAFARKFIQGSTMRTGENTSESRV